MDRHVQLCTHQCKTKFVLSCLMSLFMHPVCRSLFFFSLFSSLLLSTTTYTTPRLQGSDCGTVSHASLARLSCPTCSATTFPNQSPRATIILYYIRISMMLLTAWIPPCSQDLGAKCGHTMCTYYTTGAKHTVCTIQGTCSTIHCILHVPTTVIVYQHGTLSVCVYTTVCWTRFGH